MRFLYIGRINERQKNFSEVEKIFKAVKLNNISTSLTVFSNDKLTSNNEDIDFRGSNSDWYNTLDLNSYTLLISSWYEGMPLSLLEFIFNGGKKCLCRSAPWSRSIFSKDNTYFDIDDAINKCITGKLDIRFIDKFKTYKDAERFNKDIVKLKYWLKDLKT